MKEGAKVISAKDVRRQRLPGARRTVWFPRLIIRASFPAGRFTVAASESVALERSSLALLHPRARWSPRGN